MEFKIISSSGKNVAYYNALKGAGLTVRLEERDFWGTQYFVELNETEEWLRAVDVVGSPILVCECYDDDIPKIKIMDRD